MMLQAMQLARELLAELRSVSSELAQLRQALEAHRRERVG